MHLLMQLRHIISDETLGHWVFRVFQQSRSVPSLCQSGCVPWIAWSTAIWMPLGLAGIFLSIGSCCRVALENPRWCHRCHQLAMSLSQFSLLDCLTCPPLSSSSDLDSSWADLGVTGGTAAPPWPWWPLSPLSDCWKADIKINRYRKELPSSCLQITAVLCLSLPWYTVFPSVLSDFPVQFDFITHNSSQNVCHSNSKYMCRNKCWHVQYLLLPLYIH